MSKSNVLTQSIEDYLKAICRIEAENDVVRIKEISEAMQVTYPSTSGIIKKMEGMGLVEHERYGYVKLTASGRASAQKMLAREGDIARFLQTALGLPEDVARKDACRMEHTMSDLTADRLLDFFRQFERPNRDCAALLDAFRQKYAK